MVSGPVWECLAVGREGYQQRRVGPLAQARLRAIASVMARYRVRLDRNFSILSSAFLMFSAELAKENLM